MKKYLWNRRRWIPLTIYLVLSIIVWFNRDKLIYAHIPPVFGQRLTILYDLVLAALAFSLFACVFQAIRCPFMAMARVDNAFKQAKLKNGVGQYPSLVSVTEDPSKQHGKRYTIRNVGISINDMKSKIDSLSRELGVIYEISETPKPRYTYLYVLPGKSILPTHTPIVYDNDF